MRYLIAASLILCALILSRKPKEPNDPTITNPEPKKAVEIVRS